MWNPLKSRKPTEEKPMNDAAQAAEDLLDNAAKATPENREKRAKTKGMLKGGALVLGGVAIGGACAVAYLALRATSKAVPALEVLADQAADGAVVAAGHVVEALYR